MKHTQAIQIVFIKILLLIYVLTPLPTNGQANDIQKKTNDINTIYSTFPDSALLLVKKIKTEAIANKDTTQTIHWLITQSELNNISQQYIQSFEDSEQALYLAEEYKDTVLLADAYSRFGTLNYELFQKDESEQFIKKAISLNRYLYHKKRINANKLISSYFNLVLSYRHFEEYKKAMIYLDSCYLISNSIENHEHQGYLDVERGINQLYQKRFNEALLTLKGAATTFETIDPQKDKTNQRGYLVVVYSYLGEVYRKTGENHLACRYFKRSLDTLQMNNRHMEQKAFTLERYAWALFALEKYKEAYECIIQAAEINEKHFSTKTGTNAEFYTVRSKYREELASKNKELTLKNLEIAEKEASLLRFRILLFSIVFFLAISILIIRQKIQHRKLLKEQETIKKKQKESVELLELKNKELTVSTLKLIEKEELIKSLSNHLKEIPINSSTSTLLNSINHSNTSLWDDFNSRFIAVNNDFYDKLMEKVPELSPADLKLCALIKLNFSGKEMANLLGISLESVHKARHRLRKKLNIERDTNLTSFIASI